MTQGTLAQATCIDYGVAAKPLTGETLSGDVCLVRQIDSGVLLAVIDGLGHGAPAADAANTAIAVIMSHPGRSLFELAEHCHRALVPKRGAAMTLVSIQPEENVLNWLGIGNVWGGVIVASQPRPRWKRMPSHGGIVGFRLPRTQPTRTTLAPGDWVIVATDGVGSDLEGALATNGPPHKLAAQILSRNASGKDDSLVLVARYRGNGV